LTRADVAIVGGGIAGLACAWELVGAGLQDVLVLEAAERCGGPLESVRRGDWLLERGPTTARGTPELARLFACAGLEPLEGRRAAPLVVSGGRLVRLPPGPRELLRGDWLPLSALLSICLEPLRRARAGPRSVHEFVAERFGRAVALHVADLLTLGSFGAPAEKVGFESAFPELAGELEHAAGRLGLLALRRGIARPRRGARAALVSTRDGLAPLALQLARGLGERVRTSTPVRRVRACAHGFELECGSDAARIGARCAVLALPPAPLAAVLDSPQAGGLLEAFPSTPQTLAQFALEDRACAERWTGLGFLAPTREKLPLLGCLFPANLFPGRAPQGAMLLSVFVGPALQRTSEGELARELAPVLEHLLGSARVPELLDVARHPAGIPLYDPGHGARLRALRELAAQQPGLYLAGWGYDGIGVGAAAASGVRAARAILAAR
jgi:oxygen-dependent protoporphyrinogen oxidase